MFKIDFSELMILAKECIPPVPIARAMFFNNLSDVYYAQMTIEERENMFGIITNANNFDITNEECLHFYNRFNPDNQFKLKVKFEGEITIKNAYLHKDRYCVLKNKWIDSKYILETISK